MGEDYKDFVDFIMKHYPGAKKIVEVGIGPDRAAYEELKRIFPGEVLATDIRPATSEVIKDDIFTPDYSIYEGADLIYSIRPPPELYGPLEEMARKMGAHLIIRPLSSDSYGKSRPINHGRAIILKIL